VAWEKFGFQGAAALMISARAPGGLVGSVEVISVFVAFAETVEGAATDFEAELFFYEFDTLVEGVGVEPVGEL
jgi:hypothetical protein